jgi:4-hydroxybenzoate polyprenyltransferase
MASFLRSLAVVSRPEFLPAMGLGWFLIGFSWGVSPPAAATTLLIPAVLALAVLILSALIGAQVNTLADSRLDEADPRKVPLVAAFATVGRKRLVSVIILEFFITFALVLVLANLQGKIGLLLLWFVGIYLGYAYSAPPIRLKSRSYLSIVPLILVLCVFPVLFVYYTFSGFFAPAFLLFLAGQGIASYGLVIATEIPDYFEDRAMGVRTVTVRLGLLRASRWSFVLLVAGGILVFAAFAWVLTAIDPYLNIFLLFIAGGDYIVARKLITLIDLSKKQAVDEENEARKDEILQIARQSPGWITIVGQATVIVSLVFLAGKFIWPG